MEDKRVLKKFRSIKILTIQELTKILNSSKITARRRLKLWKAYTSINKNSRFYTLPDIPAFDRNGLWEYEKIFFSKHGNLKETISSLIRKSEAGLSANNTTCLVGLPSNSSLLSHFRNLPGIRREKFQGRYIYFSDDPGIYTKQKDALMQKDSKQFPTDAEAVVILIQLIKNPNISVEELAQRVSKEGVRIEASRVLNFLTHHGLLKKTPATEP